MTNPRQPEQLVRDNLARLSGQRSIPKAGLLVTSTMVGAARACQLIVE